MKELFFFMSRHPEVIDQVENGELSLRLDPSWGLHQDDIISLMKQKVGRSTMDIWR